MATRGYAVREGAVLTQGSLADRAQEHAGDLSGAFGVIRDGMVVTDRFGSHPVYLSGNGQASFDFWELAHGHEPNPAAAVELLTYNYALGDHTLSAGLVEAPAAARTTWSDGRWFSDRYWRYNPVAGRATASGFADTLEGVAERAGMVCQSLGMTQPGVNLTAGRDSRLVAFALKYASVRVQHYFTTEDLGREELVAAKLARALGGEHVALPMWWRDGQENPPGDVVWTVGPTTLFTVSNHPMNLSKAGPFPVDGFISGHLGDVMSGDHITSRVRLLSVKGASAVVAHLADAWAVVPAALLESLLLPEHRHLVAGARDHFRQLANTIDVEHPANIATVMDLEQRQRRFILRDYNALLTLGPSMLPLADHAWADFFSRAPLRWQFGSPLYTSGLQELFRRHGESELLRTPTNGKQLRRVRFPEGRVVADAISARLKAHAGHASAPVPWPQAETPGVWLEDLRWLCDLGTVRQQWTRLPMSTRRALETIARVSARLTR